MKKENSSFFDDLDDLDDNVTDPITDEVHLTISRIIDESAFQESISKKFYQERGFIKDGELVVNPEDIIDVHTPMDVITLENEWKITRYDENSFIVTIDDENLTSSEIESQLLRYIQANENNRLKMADFYVFNRFRENDIEHPIHCNQCFEFKGKFVFAKAVRGWVFLSYDKAVHISEE